MAKEIADFTNDSFFTVMDTPALEVAGLATLIHYKTIYTQHAKS